MIKKMKMLSVVGVAVATLLAGCGGGGGGDSGFSVGPTSPVVTPPNPASVITPERANTIVTSVPATSYSPGSEENAAFVRLNAERRQCGFGLLAQNAQLDAAAKAHNDYQIVNNIDSHFEDQQRFAIGFTGVSAADRAATQGYTGIGGITDNYTISIFSAIKTGMGERAMRSLLSAPYHLAALVDGYRDVGVSVRASTETTPQGVNPAVFLHVNGAFKTTTGKQLFGTGDINTYPCDGSIGVNRQLLNESPNPVPGRDLFRNPIGTAVYIAAREGQTLVLSSVAMTETVTNTPVALRLPVTTSNDPNGLYRQNEGYVAPDAPLKSLTKYTVMVTGANNGSAFTKTFSFTTGV